MKKLTSLGVGGGVVGLVLLAAQAGWGHADREAGAPVLAINPIADITDVYAWMNGPSFLNLVMGVSPKDSGTTGFGPSVLYVFHLTSKEGIGVNKTGGTETRVICRFTSNTIGECWVVSGATTKDYVSGDPSNPAGVTSLDGKLRLFAGRRSDPSFWKLDGFNSAAAFLAPLVRTGTDAAGCPAALMPSQANTARNALMAGSDVFAASNVMAIVIQVDKSLINAPNNVTVAVWGSTNAAL